MAHEIKVTAEIVVPLVPNFARIANSGPDATIDIADLSDTDLLVLGEAWTRKLIATAQDRRAHRNPADSRPEDRVDARETLCRGVRGARERPLQSARAGDR